MSDPFEKDKDQNKSKIWSDITTEKFLEKYPFKTALYLALKDVGISKDQFDEIFNVIKKIDSGSSIDDNELKLLDEIFNIKWDCDNEKFDEEKFKKIEEKFDGEIWKIIFDNIGLGEAEKIRKETSFDSILFHLKSSIIDNDTTWKMGRILSGEK